MGRHNIAQWVKHHRSSGEIIRWWKGIPAVEGTVGRTREGRLMIEQTLPNEARFLIGSTEENYQSVEFGLIQKGTMQISALPRWARFNHLDRIVLLAPGRVQSTYGTIFRDSNGSEDKFLYAPVKSINAVYVSGVLQNANDYEATELGINWLSGAPAAQTEYAVEYEYHPRFVVLPQKHRTSPTDKNGESLPVHYWLDVEQGTDEEF